MNFLKKQLRKIFFPDNALKREQWVRSVLNSISPGKVILDVGCGTQQYRKYCSHLKYFAQDFGQYDGVGDGNGLQKDEWVYGKLDYVGNAWDINEEDSSFDVILCTEVLEHLFFPSETIAEIARLLKPGGVLILTAPVCSVPHFSPYYFYNGFSEYYYREVARLNGLEIDYMDANGDAFEFIGVELRRTINATPYLIRLPYLIFIVISVLILRIMSKFFGVRCKYLVAGYHLIMKKNN